jgi:uncharacterized protein YjaG (DUF416 family)
MTYTFDLPAIKASLQNLDEIHQVAFGVLLLERALPDYFQFQIDTGSRGGAALRAASAQCWTVLEEGRRQGARFISVDACERSMPDSEDHASPYTSAAIDAVNIACCLLDYLESGNLSVLMEAAEARWDTYYLFILNGTNIDSEDVLNHPLMQEELRFLHEDIAFLQSSSSSMLPFHIAVLDRVSRLNYRALRLKFDPA